MKKCCFCITIYLTTNTHCYNFYRLLGIYIVPVYRVNKNQNQDRISSQQHLSYFTKGFKCQKHQNFFPILKGQNSNLVNAYIKLENMNITSFFLKPTKIYIMKFMTFKLYVIVTAIFSDTHGQVWIFDLIYKPCNRFYQEVLYYLFYNCNCQ